MLHLVNLTINNREKKLASEGASNGLKHPEEGYFRVPSMEVPS